MRGSSPSTCPATAAPSGSTLPEQRPDRPARSACAALVDRRAGGEPLQYVLGSWSFRGLDLMVDRRVLIPRPETEQVVEVALEEAGPSGLRRSRRRLAARRPSRRRRGRRSRHRLGCDRARPRRRASRRRCGRPTSSPDALDVARANVAGCAATRSASRPARWFEALPDELRGAVRARRVEPAVRRRARGRRAPEEVADYEPRGALVSGPTGTEALEYLLAHARSGSRPPRRSCASSHPIRPTP